MSPPAARSLSPSSGRSIQFGNQPAGTVERALYPAATEPVTREPYSVLRKPQMSRLVTAFRSGVKPSMRDYFIRAGIEAGGFLERSKKLFGNFFGGGINVLFRPRRTSVKNPPLALILPAWFAGIIAYPEQRRVLAAHTFVMHPGGTRKVSRNGPARQNPTHRIIKLGSQLVQAAVRQQFPGLCRRGCNDYSVKIPQIRTRGGKQRPGLVVSGQSGDTRFANETSVCGQCPGNGRHTRYADVTGFLRERFPVAGLCLKAEPACPRPETVRAGIFAKKRKEIRVTGGEILCPHIRRSTGYPFCRKPTTGPPAFFKDGDVMAKALQLNGRCQPRKA